MVMEKLGMAPQEIEDNVYIPAKTVLKTAVGKKSNYKPKEYPSPYQGDKRILVICTEGDSLEVENGAIFRTGNHPVEMFVPILHFRAAGFDVEIATPTGAPVKIEEWAVPTDDEALDGIRSELKDQLEQPSKLSEVAKNFGPDSYAAVFIPGGHGALIGLPENVDVKTVLTSAMANELTVVSLCHGPAALLSAAIDSPFDDFLFRDYEIVCNPDGMDRGLANMGYLPGKLKWGFSELLSGLGVTVANRVVTGKTHIDRTLITGDGPPAANELGEKATEVLLNKVV